MKKKLFKLNEKGSFILEDGEPLKPLGNVVHKLNEQQFIIEELKTHNLQHFLEWLVIKGYVTDEPMKDINNVIDCVNKFKEYLPVLNKITEINNEIGFDSDE